MPLTSVVITSSLVGPAKAGVYVFGNVTPASFRRPAASVTHGRNLSPSSLCSGQRHTRTGSPEQLSRLVSRLLVGSYPRGVTMGTARARAAATGSNAVSFTGRVRVAITITAARR